MPLENFPLQERTFWLFNCRHLLSTLRVLNSLKSSNILCSCLSSLKKTFEMECYYFKLGMKWRNLYVIKSSYRDYSFAKHFPLSAGRQEIVWLLENLKNFGGWNKPPNGFIKLLPLNWMEWSLCCKNNVWFIICVLLCDENLFVTMLVT